MANKSLRKRYDEYWARCKEPFLEYKAPCCNETIKTRKPGPGETWDSMIECVHCNTLFWMEASENGVTTNLPKSA